MKPLLFALLTLVPLLPTAVHATSDEMTPAQRAIYSSITEQVLSPYCPGRALRDCPSSAASELKQRIREKVMAGESEEAILAYLYATFGEEVRGAPRAEGFGLTAWIAPIAFLGLGMVLLVAWLSAQRSPESRSAASPQPLDPQLEQRIRDELSR